MEADKYENKTPLQQWSEDLSGVVDTTGRDVRGKFIRKIPVTTGWICPRCKKSNAPAQKTCANPLCK